MLSDLHSGPFFLAKWLLLCLESRGRTPAAEGVGAMIQNSERFKSRNYWTASFLIATVPPFIAGCTMLAASSREEGQWH